MSDPIVQSSFGVSETPERKRAIKRLRDALTALDKAGLCVYGMDDTLYVHDRGALDLESERTGDRYSARQNDDDAVSVIHRAYRDSGGW